MDKQSERAALDRLGWFSRSVVVYSKEISKKKREFQIRYERGSFWVLVTYQADNSGGIEVVDIEDWLPEHEEEDDDV